VAAEVAERVRDVAGWIENTQSREIIVARGDQKALKPGALDGLGIR
jgi:hypothetical protein